MTPTPPSSPEGSSLPPRHRPSLGNLAKDTTEVDLWAFEDDLDLPDEPKESQAEQAPRGANREIPAPREQTTKKNRDPNEPGVPKTPTGGEERIRMNINKARLKDRTVGPTTGQSKPESDFDELEHWEDAKLEPEIEDLPVDVGTEMTGPVEFSPLKIETMPLAEPMAVQTAAANASMPDLSVPVQEKALADDEFSPVLRENATPVSLRPHLGLSKVERIGLIALVVLLLAGGITILMISLNRLPTEPQRANSNDFPIKGSHLTISSATSYWRMPITEGPTADTVRRGTQLLPVLELAINGGPAALRVLFRNEERMVIGDAVTRSVSGAGTLKIPATAGFDDLGMHAAYRTGESKPWTIEVLEAPTVDTPGREFKKLFEMNISTDRR